MSFLSLTFNLVGFDTSVEQKCNGTKTMSNVCCKEFKGWCKSFTRTEALLSLLEAFLLLVFIGFLSFLILHLLACSKSASSGYEIIPTPQTVFSPTSLGTGVLTPDANEEFEKRSTTRQTLAPDVQCTWEPSQKTAATAHYYEHGASGATAKSDKFGTTSTVASVSDSLPAAMEDSDGEEVDEGDSFVLALVKIRPMRESTFGCALTVVSRFWVLTAASCLEAVEEVDSLDAFVMVEGWGAAEGGAAHAVADVRVHPQFAHARRARDVAALRSEDPLTVGAQGILQLPSVLDHMLITIGERFTIYGYGRFRSPEESTSGRGVRAVSVYSLPAGACAGAGDDAWAPRHLARGAPTIPATGAIGPICAGPLYARGVPCNYCAGTPLARARRLLGVMADARCGAACEPTPYVSLAAVRPWLDDLMANNISRRERSRGMNKLLLVGSVLMAVFVAGTFAAAIMQFTAGAESVNKTMEDYDV